MECVEVKLSPILFKERRIPTRWFWADHRIPQDLINISKGDNYGLPYIGMFIIRKIPNYYDLVQYYNKVYGNQYE